MDKRKFILDFIRKHKIAVLSTVSPDNKPESAAVEFGETNELEIIFDTFTSYRKYKNLKKNPSVSVVIGWDDDITVQYEGQAQELKGNELEKYKKAYFAKNPKAKRWEELEGVRYFKVIPRWIRYSDLNQHPWKIIELKL